MDSQAKESVVRLHRYHIATAAENAVPESTNEQFGDYCCLKLSQNGLSPPTFEVPAALSIRSSVEDSRPPSPSAGFPPNFARVADGIYRSSFPRLNHFGHLADLKLKTVLTLVSEEYPPENKEFISHHGINHIQIHIPAHKSPFDCIPLESLLPALQTLLNRKNHPILVHCNKGKHRTGCVVACYRKIHDWTMSSIIQEYRNYAGFKARPLDERFIEMFDEIGMSRLLNVAYYGLKITDGSTSLPTPPDSDKDVKTLVQFGESKPGWLKLL